MEVWIVAIEMICKAEDLINMVNLTMLLLQEAWDCQRMRIVSQVNIKDILMLNKELTVYLNKAAKLISGHKVLNRLPRRLDWTKNLTNTIWDQTTAIIDLVKPAKMQSKFRIDKSIAIRWVQTCHLNLTKEVLGWEQSTIEEIWMDQSVKATTAVFQVTAK